MEQEQVHTAAPTADSFQVLTESEQRITGKTKYCRFNFCHNILELFIEETEDFAVLNWVAGLTNEDTANKEIVTFMSLDSKGKCLCMLRFTQLTMLDHVVIFNEPDLAGRPVQHEVRFKFGAVERVSEPKIGG